MQIITIASQKGGTGKSTLSTHLSVLAQASNKKTILVDLDPQESATKWWNIRKVDTPRLVRATTDKLEETLRLAKEAGIDYCFIDTKPGINHTEKKAIQIAHFCLVPTCTAIFDLWAITNTLELAKTSKAIVRVVLNQCDPGRNKKEAPTTEQAKKALLSYGADIVPVTIGRRNILRSALNDGSAVTEIDPTSIAAKEMQALWKYIKKAINV